jgi:hypothetical protein
MSGSGSALVLCALRGLSIVAMLVEMVVVLVMKFMS